MFGGSAAIQGAPRGADWHAPRRRPSALDSAAGRGRAGDDIEREKSGTNISSYELAKVYENRC